MILMIFVHYFYYNNTLKLLYNTVPAQWLISVMQNQISGWNIFISFDLEYKTHVFEKVCTQKHVVKIMSMSKQNVNI